MAHSSARRLLVAALLCAGIAGAARRVDRGTAATIQGGQVDIVPKLDPKLDSHFYGSDYPHDVSPQAPLMKDFTHPYPVVQDTDTYDKDYVKDENSDNGEWRAQQEYDRLRTRMEQKKAESEKALAKKRELEKKLAEEKAKEKEIQAQKKKLEDIERKAEEAANTEMEEARKRYEQSMGAKKTTEEASTNESVGVAEATDKVKHEVDDIEDCKRRLAESQAKLKELEAELKEAEEKEHEAKAAKAAAETQEARNAKEEAEAEAKVKAEETQATEAREAYESKRDALAKMETDIKNAEDKLRKFRREGVDQDGGVYETKKSSATLGIPALWAGLVVMVSLHAAL